MANLDDLRKTDPNALRERSVSGEDMSTDGYDFDTVKSQLQEAQGFSGGQQTDLSVVGQEEQTDLSPFQQEGVPAPNPYYDSEMALRYATIGFDPISDYGQALKKGGLWAGEQILTTARDTASAALSTAVQQSAQEDDVPSPEAITQIMDEDEARFKMATGPEWAWLEQVEGAEDLPEEERRAVVADRYISRKLSELFESQGLGDWAANIAGILVVPDEAYNAKEFWQKVTGSDKDFSEYFNSAEMLHKIGSWFVELSPEEQVDMLEVFLKASEEVDDNELQQAFMVMAATGRTPYDHTQFDHFFDKATVASLGVGIGGKWINKLLRLTSMPKTLAKLGKSNEVSTVTDAAATGKITEAEAQINPLDAAVSGLPVVNGNLAKLFDTAPESFASAIRADWAMMDAMRKDGMDIAKEGLRLSPEDMYRVMEREKGRLEESVPNIENLSFKIQKDGVEFTYDTVTPTGTGRVTGEIGKTETFKYTLNDMSDGFVVSTTGPVSSALSAIVSPNVLFSKLADELVQPFELAQMSQAKLRGALTDSLALATKELKGNKRAMEQVAELITRGTLNDEVYTYEQLVSRGIGGKRYSEAQAKVYFNLRKLYDDMWVMKNEETRKVLELRGAKSVTLSSGFSGFPSVAETASIAWKKYNGSKYRTVIDDVTGETRVLGKEDIEKAYEDGMVLTRLDNSSEFWIRNETKAKFALVPRHSVDDLPDVVLGYRAGYSPLVYKNANFFVKHKKPVDDLSGAENLSYMETIRAFSNFSDAEKYAAKYATENGNVYNKDNTGDIQVLFNREKGEAAAPDEDVINMYGGYAKSPRKQERIPFGPEGTKAEFLDPIEAMQEYMFHVGNRVPITELRLGTQQKWLNTAKQLLGTEATGSFEDMYGTVKNSTQLSDGQRTFLVRAHEQIQTLNHIPTPEEQRLMGHFVSIGKSLESKSPLLKGVSRGLYTLSQTSPVGAFKAASHHMLLGMYSIAQFPVQALGASVAFSINPVYAAKGAGKWLAFSYLDNILDPAHRAAKIKELSKMKGMNLEDLEETYALWRKSGYRQSVLLTNGDYATVANGLPYDAGLVRRMFENGTFFFKAGELANMRISFATALERWKDINPGRKLDDEALKQIVARAEQFRLNMGQGNKARFQKGYISIPLQFQQINTKFAEAVLGPNFTKAERARLFAGQATLFGAMGVPLGEYALGHLVNQTESEDLSNWSAEGVNTARRGVLGWFLNNYLGLDAEVSGRVSIASGITDLIMETAFEQHSIISLAGPTGAVAERGLNSIEGLLIASKMYFTSDDLTTEDKDVISRMMAYSLANVASGTRNMVAAYQMHHSGWVRDSKGVPLWQKEPDLYDSLLQGAGFQSLKKNEYWELIKSRKAQLKSEQGMLDQMSRLYSYGLVGIEENNPEAVRAASLTIAALYSGIKDEDLKIKLSQGLLRRFRGEDKMQMAIEQAVRAYNEDTTPNSFLLNEKVRGAIEGEQ